MLPKIIANIIAKRHRNLYQCLVKVSNIIVTFQALKITLFISQFMNFVLDAESKYLTKYCFNETSRTFDITYTGTVHRCWS